MFVLMLTEISKVNPYFFDGDDKDHNKGVLRIIY